MRLSKTSVRAIRAAILRAVGRYGGGDSLLFMTDIHMQPLPSTGQLHIFDDGDRELACCHIGEWASYGGDDFAPPRHKVSCRRSWRRCTVRADWAMQD